MKRRKFLAVAAGAAGGVAVVKAKRKSNKNYYELFAEFCKENGIWFAVCSDGSVDILTAFLDAAHCTSAKVSIFSDVTVDFEGSGQFGTKEAYDWLVKEYAVIVEENKS